MPINEHVWTTKDGTEILIRDMDSFHIKNCMRIIKNNNYGYTERFGCEDYYDENYISLRGVYERMHLELRLRKLEGKENDN